MNTHRIPSDIPNLTKRIGRLSKEKAAHETFVAYEQAFERGQLEPSIENWRAAVAAYDVMIAFAAKGA